MKRLCQKLGDGKGYVIQSKDGIRKGSVKYRRELVVQTSKNKEYCTQLFNILRIESIRSLANCCNNSIPCPGLLGARIPPPPPGPPPAALAPPPPSVLDLPRVEIFAPVVPTSPPGTLPVRFQSSNTYS